MPFRDVVIPFPKIFQMRLWIVLLILPLIGRAQTPPSEWMEVNSIRARVTANGTLFTGGSQGGFLVPKSGDQDSVKMTLFRGVFPWIGGVDPAGNLRISIGTGSPTGSDFISGFMGQTGYNRIWRVTKADIQAHRADFGDNGFIDNPIAAVMDWPKPMMAEIIPGQGEQPVALAPFEDVNFNGLYEPETGEYPTAPKRFDGKLAIPDEILFFTYNDSTQHAHSKGIGLQMQIFCTLFAYTCPEDSGLHNTIFAHYQFWSRSSERVDSLYVGFLLDFQIGNANDDYLGSMNDAFYGYNGDAIDENGFLDNPPMAFVTSVYNPLDTFGGEIKSVFTPIYPTPVGATYPVLPAEFYRYLTGRFRDGMPLTAGGNGYNPGSGDPPLCCAFPGDPTENGGWSEISAGNSPGDRRAVASFGPVTLLPFHLQDMCLAFHWGRGDTPSPLSGYLPMIKYHKWLRDVLLNFHPPVPLPDCLSFISAQTIVNKETPKVYPNPASGVIRINTGEHPLRRVRIFDFSGKMKLLQNFSGHIPGFDAWEVSVSSLTAGVYLMEMEYEKGQLMLQKIVVLP